MAKRQSFREMCSSGHCFMAFASSVCGKTTKDCFLGHPLYESVNQCERVNIDLTIHNRSNDNSYLMMKLGECKIGKTVAMKHLIVVESLALVRIQLV